ncbi:MAG TPA: RDD family protein [Candidatus Dormibacteraeota bacterium]|nr:RDD family protein [Candidatus Dormibacteraeota bacterium]
MNSPPPPSFGAQPVPVSMSAPSNLASPGLRVVGGLINVVILAVLFGVVEAITNRNHGGAGLVDLAVALGYFGYFWSSGGQTVGMMVFGFRVRDRATGRFPSVGKAVLRGFVWWLEVWFTICVIGLVGWLWMFWDSQRQGFHDKVAGTVVTKG